MDVLNSIPPLYILNVYLFPAILFGVAITSFVSPSHTAEMMGFNSTKKDKTMNLFVYAFGVRELAIAACVSLLVVYDQWKALTIVMACGGLNGLGDTIIDGFQGQGWKHAIKTHGIPTVIGYWGVWRLYQDL